MLLPKNRRSGPLVTLPIVPERQASLMLSTIWETLLSVQIEMAREPTSVGSASLNPLRCGVVLATAWDHSEFLRVMAECDMLPPYAPP